MGDTTKAPAGVSEGSEGLDKAADAITGDAEDAEKGSEPTDGTVDDNADATESDSAANAGDENGGNSSKNSSADHENDGNPADDSTQNDNPPAPVDTDAEGNSPVDLPSEDDNATPPFSGDDSSNASLVTPKDSNAPPGARVDSPPPPDDGTYFIRWETYPTYWMGQENEKLIVKINPESTYALDWVVAHIRGAAYDNVYSLRCGDFYLARLGATEDDPSGHNVGLSADLNDNSYWRIVGYSNIAGETVYYLFDMNEVNALTFTMDYDWNVDGFICDSYGQDMMSLGSQYRFFFDRAQPQDWTIRYDGNGATEGNVTGTTVTVADGGTIADNDYKRFGYEFAGWNTAADGTGTMYTPGEHVDAGEVLASGFVLRLYAQWNELFANITYTTAGGGEVQLGTDGAKDFNIIQTVSSATGILKDTADEGIQGVTAVAAPGYHFGSWVINGGIGEISDLLKHSATLTADQVRVLSRMRDEATGWSLFRDVTLLADFLANKFIINFDANGGTGSMSAKTLEYGEVNPVTGMNGLSRVSYRFGGWNTKADGNRHRRERCRDARAAHRLGRAAQRRWRHVHAVRRVGGRSQLRRQLQSR